MGAEYIVFGRAIPTYKLALATYAAIAVPIVAMKATKKEAPVNVITAASADEAAFIREFIKAAEGEHHHNV
ncbi:hypothetical protein EDD11_000628 [Mortierella claussenii]|nr:hypothetical protein EDD11_000628 [Mortierella claussenii]